MKAWIRESSLWTPERGALSAEDGLAGVSRFARTCAALVERVLIPDADALVILGTSSDPPESPSKIVDELQTRWPGARVEIVVAGADTVPLSCLDALTSVGRGSTILWTVVDLKPGVELAAVVHLSSDPTPTTLEISRTDGAPHRLADHLNCCAAVLSLLDTVGTQSVSIKVGSWCLAVTTTA